VDRKLLDLLQREVPLVPRPFAVLGRELDIGEEEVLCRTQRLEEAGIIRQMGPIFSSRRLGYQSTLAAFRVAPQRLDEVAEIVSAHPGVSHNYSRKHNYNLWFTLTLPPNQDLEDEIAGLAEEGQVDDYLNLPSVRRFKIGVHFHMSGNLNDVRRAVVDLPPERPAGARLTDFERDVVRILQGRLPLTDRPFQGTAEQLGVTEGRLLEAARDLDQRGVIRRFSAVLKHRRAGFTANGMACWVIPNERIAVAGLAAAAHPAVSHCYQRPAFPPRWPYNLFTMVHGQARDQVERIVERIRQEIEPTQHVILCSEKEFKKERVRYFTHL
jgi:DNA-binding Lrp family transcriptional regulator